jgi:hypothetical protein
MFCEFVNFRSDVTDISLHQRYDTASLVSGCSTFQDYGRIPRDILNCRKIKSTCPSYVSICCSVTNTIWTPLRTICLWQEQRHKEARNAWRNVWLVSFQQVTKTIIKWYGWSVKAMDYEGQARASADVYNACMARGQGTHLRNCGK